MTRRDTAPACPSLDSARILLCACPRAGTQHYQVMRLRWNPPPGLFCWGSPDLGHFLTSVWSLRSLCSRLPVSFRFRQALALLTAALVQQHVARSPERSSGGNRSKPVTQCECVTAAISDVQPPAVVVMIMLLIDMNYLRQRLRKRNAVHHCKTEGSAGNAPTGTGHP